MPSYRNLRPGEPAPWFIARASTRDEYAFDTAGGRYLVLCFFATADERGSRAIRAAMAHPDLFDDEMASFFGVSVDPVDQARQRLPLGLRGYRFFWDFAGEICRLYGAIPHDAGAVAKQQTIRTALQQPDVQRVASTLGVDIARAEGAIATLAGSDLDRAAAQAQLVNDEISGGQTVRLNLLWVIIGLLVIILIIVAS